MAHIRTNHPIRMWTGKQEPETALDRLVVLTWKTNKETGIHHSARCFSVPMWSPQLMGQDTGFIDMLIEAFEARQKAIAFEYVTKMLDTNGGVCNDIPAAILEPQAVLAHFIAENEENDGSRGKLSSKQIAEWFEATLKPLVQVKIMEVKGWGENGNQITEEQLKKLDQSANGYRATLEKLASPKVTITVDTARMLQNAVNLLGNEKDIIARKLDKKLERIINPPQESIVTLESLS